MSPAEYAHQLASTWPPLTAEQIESAARILAGVESEPVAA